TGVGQVGNMTGMQSMQKDGKEQHMKGEAEQKTAQAQEYGSGMLDRATGAIKEMAGGIMGDSTQKAEGMSISFHGAAVFTPPSSSHFYHRSPCVRCFLPLSQSCRCALPSTSSFPAARSSPRRPSGNGGSRGATS
ncbi:hypothetical protein B0H19DRAFT_964219, partial [Mycena capillaripes]